MPLSPDLERVVRPFQDRTKPLPRSRTYWNGTPTPPAETTTDPESTEGVLTWSARANMQVETLPGLSVILKEDDKDSDWEQFEIERETTTKRIFNPNDGSQFIDVEDTTAINLKNKAGQQRRLVFSVGDD